MTRTATLDVGAYFEGLDHLGVVKQLLAEPGVQAATSNPGSTSVTVKWEQHKVILVFSFPFADDHGKVQTHLQSSSATCTALSAPG